MKNVFKLGIAALAIAVLPSAFAQGDEEIESSVEGYTPVAIGLATPVQLPWGLNRWDVFGIDINAFYTDAPKLYGHGFGGLATLTRDTNIGCVVSGLANVAFDDVYALRVCAGVNYSDKDVVGADIGLVGFRDNLWGLDVNGLGAYQQKMCGAQISGLANLSKVESYGAAIAGIANLATTSYGLQMALVFNMTQELHGAQVGLVNYAEDCPSGFQIGLVNIILQNRIKFLPIVNGYF